MDGDVGLTNREHANGGRFDFIAILDLIEDRLTIAEMRKELDNGWIRVNALTDGLSLDYRESVFRELNKPFPPGPPNARGVQLTWFPFLDPAERE